MTGKEAVQLEIFKARQKAGHFTFGSIQFSSLATIKVKSVGTLDIFQTNFPLTP